MELDPKEVLYHLNRMGYKNITATQLKDFMKDLKKLIAYETKSTKCSKGNRNFVQECMKSLTAGAIRDPPPIINPEFAPVQPEKTPEPQPKKISRGVSTDQQSKKVETIRPNQESNKENVSRPCSRASKASTGTKTFTVDEKIDDDTSQKGDERVKMWIRTSRPKSLTHRNDPVELYHKYKKEWERYKPFIPGENDHSELRWRIRSKLLS